MLVYCHPIIINLIVTPMLVGYCADELANIMCSFQSDVKIVQMLRSMEEDPASIPFSTVVQFSATFCGN
jgi:hypothetical protein